MHPGPAVLIRPTRLKLALLSTWATRCGIADYSSFLTGGLPPTVDWRIYAEAASCGAPPDDRVSLNWERGLGDLSRLAASLREERPDVLLVQHNPAFFDEAALAKLFELGRANGVVVAVTLHSAQGLSLKNGFSTTLSRADRVYVHRASDARWLGERGVASNVRVIPQGVPSVPPRTIDEAKRAAGLPPGLVIGHFGFLRPHKGTLELIDAFGLLAARFPHARLLLTCSEYPSADSREYRVACERRVAASPFRSRIRADFTHLPFEEVGLLLQACDVVVFPYGPTRESSSAAVRLAVAARRPVLVSAAEIFEDLAGTAEIVPSTDVETLARHLRQFLDDPDRLRACRDRVSAFAESTAWPRVGQQMLDDLESLAGTSGANTESAARPAASLKP